MLKELLFQEAEQGTPLFYDYLKQQGYSRQLLYKYVRNRWLEKIASGVYKRSGEVITIPGILRAMTEQLGIRLRIGARSSLEIQGSGFNLRQQMTYFVYVPQGFRLTPWLKSNKLITWLKDNSFPKSISEHLVQLEGVTLSSRELAMLETLVLVPQRIDFEEAFHLMEMLPALRADSIQELIQVFPSIKARRLFLYMAEQINHPWFKRLLQEKIDLGHGDRQITQNGRYVKKYRLVIPKGTI